MGGTEASASARGVSIDLLDGLLVAGLAGRKTGDVKSLSVRCTSDASLALIDVNTDVRLGLVGDGDRTLPAGVVAVVGVTVKDNGLPGLPSTP